MDAELQKASWDVCWQLLQVLSWAAATEAPSPSVPLQLLHPSHRGKKINCCKPLQNKIYFRASSESELHNSEMWELTSKMLRFIKCSRILPNTDFKSNV
jgi:hypothetical protein